MRFSDITFFDNPSLDIISYCTTPSRPYYPDLIYVGKLRSMEESFFTLIQDFSVISISISHDKIYLTLSGNLEKEE